MIEAIMFFVLGFLAASLVALLLLSAVWHRAVRLTTRRIEGAIPVSMAEIQADKDQLRAEFAMSTRRLESSVEQLKLKTTEQLAEIGRKSETIRLLKAEMEEKSAAITALEAQERALRDRLRSTEEELSVKAKALHEAEAELADKNNQLAQMTRTLSEKRTEIDSHRVEIVALETQCQTLKGRIADLEREVAVTEERLAEERQEAKAELAAKADQLVQLTRTLADKTAEADSHRVEIVALETQCQTLKDRITDLEREVAVTENRLAEERGKVDETSRTLAEERDHVEFLTRRLTEMETLLAEGKAYAEGLARTVASLEADARRQAELAAEREKELLAGIAERETALAEVRAELETSRAETLAAQREIDNVARSYSATIENLKAEKSMLEGALVQVREDRERLQQEVAALKLEAEKAWAAERMENALLRERINDVAAEVARLAANLEGSGSPIEQILSEAPPPAPRQNGPGRAANAAANQPDAERPLSLAERIRALQLRSTRR